MPEKLMSPQELADYLDLPLRTIYGWRSTGVGPPALKCGRHLRYRPLDVEGWLKAQADPPTAERSGLASAKARRTGTVDAA